MLPREATSLETTNTAEATRLTESHGIMRMRVYCVWMTVVIVVIFIISLLKEKGIHIREKIATKNIAVRWSLYYALIISIIVFGTYGLGIVPLDPMYANF